MAKSSLESQVEAGWSSDASVAYAIMRVTFGINLFLRGLMRIIGGTGVFAEGMVKQFETAPLPAALVMPFALTLPWIETLIGLCTILGFQTRLALIGGGLMMAALTFGTMLRLDFQTAFLQLSYVLIFFVLLACRCWNLISIDGMKGK